MQNPPKSRKTKANFVKQYSGYCLINKFSLKEFLLESFIIIVIFIVMDDSTHNTVITYVVKTAFLRQIKYLRVEIKEPTQRMVGGKMLAWEWQDLD